MDLQWIFKNADQVKRVIVAVCSEETQKDIADLKEKFDEILELVFDVMREPAQELGLEIERSRGFLDPTKRLKILEQLERLSNIIAYKSDEEE
jgi:hypothetical protein